MSSEAVAAVLAHSESKGSVRLVAVTIAHHIGEDPREGCYPSQALLEVETGLSVRQIRRNIQELVNLGELEVWQHDGDSKLSYRRANRYYLLVECPEWCDRSMGHKELGSWSKLSPVDNSVKTPSLSTRVGGHTGSTGRTSKADWADNDVL